MKIKKHKPLYKTTQEEVDFLNAWSALDYAVHNAGDDPQIKNAMWTLWEAILKYSKSLILGPYKK